MNVFQLHPEIPVPIYLNSDDVPSFRYAMPSVDEKTERFSGKSPSSKSRACSVVFPAQSRAMIFISCGPEGSSLYSSYESPMPMGNGIISFSDSSDSYKMRESSSKTRHKFAFSDRSPSISTESSSRRFLNTFVRDNRGAISGGVLSR